MSDTAKNPQEPISLWQGRAKLGGRGWTDAAYGFGGPDVAEAIGTADQVGTELTRFLNTLGCQDVEGARLRTGELYITLEVEPQEQGTPTLPVTGRDAEDAGDDRVLQWEADARCGNADGVFDACYSFGNSHDDEGHLLSSAEDIGMELARVLNSLTHDDVETMKYETNRFFIDLVVRLPEADGKR